MGRYRYDPLPGQHYIRLATIHPGKFNDKIAISFHTSKFPNNILPYEALSYVWGSKKGRTSIHVSRVDATTTNRLRDTVQMKFEKLGVTRSLDIALRHLRDDKTPRVVWIDALCINQTDELEKGPQVAMMGEIFRLARQVVAWLGPEANDSNRAMYLMDYIGSQVEVDFVMQTIRPAMGCTDSGISNRNIALPFQDEDIYSIYHLLSRQWFDRLWIRQEIYLASPEAVIMCGLKQVKWTSFRRGLGCNFMKPIPQSDFSGQCETRIYALQGFIFQKKLGNLIGLDSDYNSTQCLDPRDRLYAISALLNAHDKALIPSPDYTQPYDKLYTTVVGSWIKRYESLNILHRCQLQGGTCPSWVPDWSKLDSRPNMLVFKLYLSPLVAWYKFPQPGVLRVMGVSSCAVSVYHQLPQMSRSKKTMLEQIRTLLLKVDLEQQHTTEYYTRLLAHDRFANSSDPPDFSLPDFEEAKQLVEFIMSNCDFNDVNNEDFVQSLGVSNFLSVVHCLTSGRRSIQCTGGYMGVTPALAQPGDEVYILLGCSHSLLLRPQGNNKFKVIGRCFVPGLMYGEALLGPLPDNIRIIECYDERVDNYATAFRDISSGEIFYEDPRLKSLPVDLEDFRRRLQGNPRADLYVEPDIFRERGVDLKCIDLV
ncbi:HET-domain-containing protein [Daldinia vernicosa]|uniref:HET-domain-containing protein n=1 Tax=Daldinia vernicosa TaxID=114800 RepID=UPI0020080490|nr:HET-domain-containing protein [Daldinia vernicosa]KAI0851771.1 HET-domain-containing protein [Daldinia vernicosa]